MHACIHMHTHAYTCIHMHTHAYTCIHTGEAIADLERLMIHSYGFAVIHNAAAVAAAADGASCTIDLGAEMAP